MDVLRRLCGIKNRVFFIQSSTAIIPRIRAFDTVGSVVYKTEVFMHVSPHTFPSARCDQCSSFCSYMSTLTGF
jgi:hypothetical protein